MRLKKNGAVSNQSTMKLFIRCHDFHHALLSWSVEVLQSHMEEHALEHNVTFICIYSEALSGVCVLWLCACAAGFDHTLAGKGLEGCVLSLPALRTKHSFSHAAPLPHCQHSRGKTANAIFSNGCYGEGKIVVWRSTGCVILNTLWL